METNPNSGEEVLYNGCPLACQNDQYNNLVGIGAPSRDCHLEIPTRIFGVSVIKDMTYQFRCLSKLTTCCSGG